MTGGGGSVSGGPVCDAPVIAPSGGSCVTVATGSEYTCNPVTGAPCDIANGETCDFDGTAFSCLPPPNDVSLCGDCSGLGEYCAPTLTCIVLGNGDQCARYCCNDADCAGGKCEGLTDPLHAGKVFKAGVCVNP
jgi:hypothetical protein